jgi:hypothetical protein
MIYNNTILAYHRYDACNNTTSTSTRNYPRRDNGMQRNTIQHQQIYSQIHFNEKLVTTTKNNI